ncbi:MAG: FtsW/RodA/SpoVE family cell cycle protein [Lachnospiraceae bacterium]|nr:FtsW/RodA/SpoVE family cell cycle protein [Lachnospiraceae bacterium]
MFNNVYTQILEAIQKLINSSPFFTEGFGIIMQFLFPILSLFILAGTIISLLTLPKDSEIWAKLVSLTDGKTYFITHWENIIGRATSSDITINFPSVSRQHASLIRDEQGNWKVYDLDSSQGIYVNDEEIVEDESVKYGDTITFANYKVRLEPITAAEKHRAEKKRRRFKPIPPWTMLLLLTIFQFFTAFTLIINAGEDASIYIVPAFSILTLTMWLYFIDMRILGIKGFEMEIIAFYLSTLSLAIVGSYAPSSLMKQSFSIVIGVAFLICFGMFLRNLKRVQMFRWVMAAATIGMLLITVILGARKFGAINWISIFGISVQLSEIAKICYIFAGAATLDRLFKKRNIGLFIALTLVSIAILAYCSDFGTASIFFITFIVIAYLRSGSLATITFICSGAVFGALLIITAKPYIFNRFSSWRHAWEYAGSTGYQQVNTMVAINNGGFTGVGAGKGTLAGKHVAAADTDLVFGMLCEEWGIFIALFAICCILTLAVFAIRSCINSRSTFYTIAACAATSLLLFQTALNVFGAVDILPLTGVTFPFVSNGGSSMVMAWGALAYLKATDTRPSASFAARLKKSEQAPTAEALKRKAR